MSGRDGSPFSTPESRKRIRLEEMAKAGILPARQARAVAEQIKKDCQKQGFHVKVQEVSTDELEFINIEAGIKVKK